MQSSKNLPAVHHVFFIFKPDLYIRLPAPVSEQSHSFPNSLCLQFDAFECNTCEGSFANFACLYPQIYVSMMRLYWGLRWLVLLLHIRSDLARLSSWTEFIDSASVFGSRRSAFHTDMLPALFAPMCEMSVTYRRKRDFVLMLSERSISISVQLPMLRAATN